MQKNSLDHSHGPNSPKLTQVHENLNELAEGEYKEIVLPSLSLTTTGAGGLLLGVYQVVDGQNGFEGRAVKAVPKSHWSPGDFLRITLKYNDVRRLRFAYYGDIGSGEQMVCKFYDIRGQYIGAMALPHGYRWLRHEVYNESLSIGFIEMGFGVDLDSGFRAVDSFTLWRADASGEHEAHDAV